MNDVLCPASLPSAPLDDRPTDELFTELYRELHRLARREIAVRGGQAALGATTLLHEAYMQVAARTHVAFPDRERFLAYASRVMRGLIIDHVRRRRAAKRGGLFEITAMDTTMPEAIVDHRQLEQISEALDALAAVDAASAQIVDLKFFCGFSFLDIAAMRGVSERTVQRQWEKARLYLHRVLGSTPLA